MDIVAHALWATAVGRTWNGRGRTRFKVARFVAWTMFPDLFAFTPMAIAVIWNRLSGASRLPHVHTVAGFNLYELSHSFVVFFLVFAAASLLLRRPVWEMLGWALHIAIDIPTHSRYTTPFLWPLSDYRFRGVGWWEPWFMAVNYAALAMVFLVMWLRGRRAREVVETRL